MFWFWLGAIIGLIIVDIGIVLLEVVVFLLLEIKK